MAGVTLRWRGRLAGVAETVAVKAKLHLDAYDTVTVMGKLDVAGLTSDILGKMLLVAEPDAFDLCFLKVEMARPALAHADVGGLYRF